jgi:hypothetical protein
MRQIKFSKALKSIEEKNRGRETPFLKKGIFGSTRRIKYS